MTKCLLIHGSGSDRAEARRVLEALKIGVTEAADADYAVSRSLVSTPDIVLVGEWNGGMSRADLVKYVLGLWGERPKLLQWFDEDTLYEGQQLVSKGLTMQVAAIPSRPTEDGFDGIILRPLDRVEVILKFSQLGLK